MSHLTGAGVPSLEMIGLAAEVTVAELERKTA